MAVKKTQNDGYAQLRADMAAGTLAPARSGASESSVPAAGGASPPSGGDKHSNEVRVSGSSGVSEEGVSGI